MNPHLNINENLVQISFALGQYPILSPAIRARMRRELFTRGQSVNSIPTWSTASISTASRLNNW